MRIGGLASGIDTHQMIDELMRAERIPLDRLFQQRTWIEWQRDAYREVNLAISKFRDAHEKLRLQATFNTFVASSSNEQLATATTTGAAVTGSYTLSVSKVAQVAKLTSVAAITHHNSNERVTGSTNVFEAMNRDPGEGEFTFKVKSGNLEKTITVTEEDTFASLASKLSGAAHDLEDNNEGKSLGIRASFDNTTGRFFISSKETGADQAIVFEDNGIDFIQHFIIGDTDLTGSNIVKDGNTFTVRGQDAEFTFDGIEITSKTNTVRVHGLDITIRGASETESTIITVTTDANKVIEDIKSFVNSYNELIADLQAKLNEPRFRDFPALTDEQRKELSDKEIELWEEKAKSGLLRSDGLIRSILSDMRLALAGPVEGIPAGELNMLSQIGITTSKDWRMGGALVIDEDKLRQALLEKPDEVRNLFTQRKSADTPVAPGKREADYDGIGFRMQNILNNAINQLREKAGMPGNTNRTDQSNLGKQLTRFDDRIANFERRLAMIEERYWRQFTAMEKALAEMNSQSAWMMQSLFGGMM